MISYVEGDCRACRLPCLQSEQGGFGGVASLVGVQMFRHRKWMRILLPQMADKNRVQQKLARKKFFRLMRTFESTQTGRHVAPSGARALV